MAIDGELGGAPVRMMLGRPAFELEVMPNACRDIRLGNDSAVTSLKYVGTNQVEDDDDFDAPPGVGGAWIAGGDAFDQESAEDSAEESAEESSEATETEESPGNPTSGYHSAGGDSPASQEGTSQPARPHVLPGGGPEVLRRHLSSIKDEGGFRRLSEAGVPVTCLVESDMTKYDGEIEIELEPQDIGCVDLTEKSSSPGLESRSDLNDSVDKADGVVEQVPYRDCGQAASKMRGWHSEDIRRAPAEHADRRAREERLARGSSDRDSKPSSEARSSEPRARQQHRQGDEATRGGRRDRRKQKAGEQAAPSLHAAHHEEEYVEAPVREVKLAKLADLESSYVEECRRREPHAKQPPRQGQRTLQEVQEEWGKAAPRSTATHREDAEGPLARDAQPVREQWQERQDADGPPARDAKPARHKKWEWDDEASQQDTKHKELETQVRALQKELQEVRAEKEGDHKQEGKERSFPAGASPQEWASEGYIARQQPRHRGQREGRQSHGWHQEGEGFPEEDPPAREVRIAGGDWDWDQAPSPEDWRSEPRSKQQYKHNGEPSRRSQRGRRKQEEEEDGAWAGSHKSWDVDGPRGGAWCQSQEALTEEEIDKIGVVFDHVDGDIDQIAHICKLSVRLLQMHPPKSKTEFALNLFNGHYLKDPSENRLAEFRNQLKSDLAKQDSYEGGWQQHRESPGDAAPAGSQQLAEGSGGAAEAWWDGAKQADGRRRRRRQAPQRSWDQGWRGGGGGASGDGGGCGGRGGDRWHG